MPLTDDRSTVFAAVRAALAGQTEKVALPDWEDSVVVCNPPQSFATLAEHFRFKFEATGALVVAGWGELKAFLQERNLTHGYTDPALAQHLQGDSFSISTDFDRARVDDYQFSVTRATRAIAETGSIILTESDSSSRLAALAPWVHIAVLQISDIAPDMPSAITQFGSERASLFVTGPSKTADVEGILIQGVHGPGIQVCCLI